VTIDGAREADLVGNILVRGSLRDIDSKNDFFSSGARLLQPTGTMVCIRWP